VSGRESRTGFFAKPTYRTKSGKAQLAVYFQAAPRRGESGEPMQPFYSSSKIDESGA
jgi:hypothetical protein